MTEDLRNAFPGRIRALPTPLVWRLMQSSALVMALGVPAGAQDAGEMIDNRRVEYSPYPEQNFPNRVFFGDTHLDLLHKAVRRIHYANPVR